MEVIGVVEGPGHGDLQVASRPFIDGVGSPRADHGVGESPRCGRLIDVDRHRAAAVAQKELAEQPAWPRVPPREQRAAQLGRAGADEGPSGIEADDMGDAGDPDVAIRPRQSPAEGHRLADNGSSRQAKARRVAWPSRPRAESFLPEIRAAVTWGDDTWYAFALDCTPFT